MPNCQPNKRCNYKHDENRFLTRFVNTDAAIKIIGLQTVLFNFTLSSDNY